VDRGLLHRLLARISDAAFVRRRVVMNYSTALELLPAIVLGAGKTV
jgi:hypothetical protein